jgi:dienelactone hydrolase
MCGALLLGTSCTAILPDNVDAPQDVTRTLVREAGGARFAAEDGLTNGVWLEVPRAGEPGYVGGYLSQDDTHRGALLLVLPGASTYYPGGMVAKVRDYHEHFSAMLRKTGLMTWTLAVRECGTPYGGKDLTDVLDALDWLAGGGMAVLGVDRVYVVGYSSGATLTVLANERRTVRAVVEIDGLTGPSQLERYWGLYRFIADLFPWNTGLFQLGATLDSNGPPGAPGWDMLDAVRHVAELRSPMLVLHGERDIVFLVDNARALQAAYEPVQAQGTRVPEVEFTYLPTGDHFNPIERDDVVDQVLEFLERF